VIGRHDLLPKFAASCTKIQAKHASRYFVPAPHVQRPSIRGPLDGHVTFGDAGYGARFTPIHRIELGILSGLGDGNPVAVRGKNILSQRYLDVFRHDGLEFAPFQIANVKTAAVAGLASCHQNALAIRKPPGPLIVDGIAREHSGFTRSRRQQAKLRRRSRHQGQDRLAVGGYGLSAAVT
jgi:hypothetical protein